jgi:hypothetical protein
MNRGLASTSPRPRSPGYVFFGSQRTFAVTEAPSRKADSKAKIVAGGPPSLVRRWVRKRPGTFSEGDTKIICKDGIV